MNFKIWLFITLVTAIACTTCVDARTKRSRRRKENHGSTTNHKNSAAHHSERGHNIIESEQQHSTNNLRKHQINIEVANRKNNQQPISRNRGAQPSKSGDYAAGYNSGFNAARRRYGSRHTIPTTTIAPTTIAPTTITQNPYSNNTLVANNNQQQNSSINSEAANVTTSLPILNNLSENNTSLPALDKLIENKLTLNEIYEYISKY